MKKPNLLGLFTEIQLINKNIKLLNSKLKFNKFINYLLITLIESQVGHQLVPYFGVILKKKSEKDGTSVISQFDQNHKVEQFLYIQACATCETAVPHDNRNHIECSFFGECVWKH